MFGTEYNNFRYNITSLRKRFSNKTLNGTMHLSSGHAITQNENAFTNYRLTQNAQRQI